MTETKRERIDALYRKICDGGEGACGDLIVEMMPIVESAARMFVSKRPAFGMLYDDLAGEAYLKLTQIVMGFKEPHEAIENPRSFILKSVDRAIGQYCDTATLPISQSDRTARRRLRDGGGIAAVGDPMPGEVIEDHGQESQRRSRDLYRDLKECCRTTLEHGIVSLRARGLVDSEIADELNVSRQDVSAARAAIRARYESSSQSEGSKA